MWRHDAELEWHEDFNEDMDEYMFAEFTISLAGWNISASELAAAIVDAITKPESWVLRVSGETVREEAPYLADEVMRQLTALKEKP